MTVSSAELTALSNEISRLATGSHIGKIHHSSDGDLCLLLGGPEKKVLFICSRAPLGRIYLTSTKTPAARTPSAFAQLLRKHLSGQKLETIFKRPNDRMVKISFLPSGSYLYCRFYGGGGFLLADKENKILGMHKFAHEPPLKTGEKYESPPPPDGDEPETVFDGSPSEIIEKRFTLLISKTGYEEGKIAALAATKREIKKCKKLQAGLGRDKEKLSAYSKYKKWGDLCRTYFNEIKAGSSETSLTDPSTGEKIIIKLQPELSVSDNVNLLYRKHKKYLSGTPKIESALTNVKEKLENFERKATELQNTKTMAELEALTGKKPQKAKKGKSLTRAKAQKPPWRVFTSADGFEINVGRNDKQNDQLVRKSNGNDIWLHTRDFPGSHVVVKAGGKKREIPLATIKEAAQYALKYSTLAKSGKGLVIYTQIKHVKRPKKAPPGKVLVTQEKTIHVRIS